MRRWTVTAGTALAGAVLVAALAACTQSGDAGAGVRSAGSPAGGGKLAPPAAGAAGGAAAPAAGPAARSAAGRARPLAFSSSEIRVAQLTVDVRRGGVPAAADRAESIALGVGGEVDGDDRSSGPAATASLQLRVPPDALRDVLGRLSGLGHEVGRHETSTDVTEQVADVNSRVASARESIARLRSLYATATTVSDVIAVESELSTREADLESLEAQQRALARQTSMATIDLTLRTAAAAAKPPVHHHARGGFVGGLERGWHGFLAAAGWVATALAVLLPFLVLLAALAGLGWLGRRRLRRPHPTPAE